MFPRRLAALDVGSNAIRFVAVEVREPGRWETLDSRRLAIRLGTDAFGPGTFAPETLRAAAEGLRELRQRMDELGVGRYRAVATSATRESQNGSELVRLAWQEAGLRLEVLSGQEEAALVWRAARERIGRAEAPWVLMDLGGGSVEVTHVDGGRTLWTESEALGTVRLLSESGSDARTPDGVRARLRAFQATLRRRLEQSPVRPSGLVATGGNIEALADLAGSPATEGGVRIVPVAALREQVERLAGMTVEERVRELGMGPDRADVVLPAAVVYAEVAGAVGVDEVHVPYTGLKEGILLQETDGAAADAEASVDTRVAFLSDIHGNVLALRAALETAERAGARRVVVAGDVVGEGPHPVECIRLLRERGLEAILGNVDRKALRLSKGKKRKKLEKWVEEKGASLSNRAWTALRLKESKDDRGWLDELPAERRLEIGGHQVLVVHGSPRSDTDYIFPSLTEVGLRVKLEPLKGERPRVLVSGHSHVPFVKEVDGVLVVNCGSVGRSKDGDWRGSMVIADLDAEPRAEVVRFEYPLDALIRDLEERGVPGVTAESYRVGVK